ncbi:unnamed protein product [Scytosiphon promiscuus]
MADRFNYYSTSEMITMYNVSGTQQKPRATPLTMYLRRCSYGVVTSFFNNVRIDLVTMLTRPCRAARGLLIIEVTYSRCLSEQGELLSFVRDPRPFKRTLSPRCTRLPRVSNRRTSPGRQPRRRTRPSSRGGISCSLG